MHDLLPYIFAADMAFPLDQFPAVNGFPRALLIVERGGSITAWRDEGNAPRLGNRRQGRRAFGVGWKG